MKRYTYTLGARIGYQALLEVKSTPNGAAGRPAIYTYLTSAPEPKADPENWSFAGVKASALEKSGH